MNALQFRWMPSKQALDVVFIENVTKTSLIDVCKIPFRTLLIYCEQHLIII